MTNYTEILNKANEVASWTIKPWPGSPIHDPEWVVLDAEGVSVGAFDNPRSAELVISLAQHIQQVIDENQKLLAVIHTASARLYRNEEYPDHPDNDDVDDMASLLAQTFLKYGPGSGKEPEEYLVISRSLMDALEREAGLMTAEETDELERLREDKTKLIEALRPFADAKYERIVDGENAGTWLLTLPDLSFTNAAKVVAEV